VPEENFWTLWCKGRLTEADTLTIRLGTTPSGLTSAHFHHPPCLDFTKFSVNVNYSHRSVLPDDKAICFVLKVLWTCHVCPQLAM